MSVIRNNDLYIVFMYIINFSKYSIYGTLFGGTEASFFFKLEGVLNVKLSDLKNLLFWTRLFHGS